MKNKKVYVFIGVSVLLIAAGVGTWIYLKRNPSKTDSTGKDDKNVNPKIKTPQAQTPAAFPLKVGSKGSNVTNVNMALGLAPSNVFSANTETALQQKFGISQISEAQYNSAFNLISKYV